MYCIQIAWRPDRDTDKRNWLLDKSSRFRNVYWYRLVAYESRPALTRINFLGWSMLINNSASSINVWSVIDRATFRFRLIFIRWQWISVAESRTRDRKISIYDLLSSDFKSIIKISDRQSSNKANLKRLSNVFRIFSKKKKILLFKIQVNIREENSDIIEKMIFLKTNIELKSTRFSKIRCIFVDILTIRIVFIYQNESNQQDSWINLELFKFKKKNKDTSFPILNCLIKTNKINFVQLKIETCVQMETQTRKDSCESIPIVRHEVDLLRTRLYDVHRYF